MQNRGKNEYNPSEQETCSGQIAGLYDLESTLGRGHFAVVKLARHVFTGEKVAVKVIDKSKLDETSKAHLFQEIRCMKLVQHPNVVRLYEVIDTATKLYLVLELGDGGDLYENILKYSSGLPEKIAKDYFRQIVKAIAYCHELHVVHRDLKPENVIFFKKQGVVKLTDFGFSNKFYPGQKLHTSCGSLAYSAPEILLGDSYEAPAVDVWSLGVILYMLVCGRPPFQEANDSETLTMIMDCKYHIPNHVSDECKRLISRMLIKIPEKRASLIDISKSSWLVESIRNCSDSFLLPLVTTEQPSKEEQNLILQKMVNGNIATKEEILESLEKNAYNHITATYYLLAERKLRSKRQEFLEKYKRPEQLTVSQPDTLFSVKPLLLKVPFTPGDCSQRNRKCSIVREDEEGEGSGLDEENLEVQLNRRGSRSEGRLHLTIQDKLVEFRASQLAVKLDEHRCSYNDIHKKLNTRSIKNNKSHTQDMLRASTNNSSDTSDDDTDKREKIGTLNISTKSYQIRRDSNDDSDSQQQGACSSSGLIVVTTYSVSHESSNIYSDKHDNQRNPKTNKQGMKENIRKLTRTILNRLCQSRDYRFSFINISFSIPSVKKINSKSFQNPNKLSKTIEKRRKPVINLQKILSVHKLVK